MQMKLDDNEKIQNLNIPENNPFYFKKSKMKMNLYEYVLSVIEIQSRFIIMSIRSRKII